MMNGTHALTLTRRLTDTFKRKVKKEGTTAGRNPKRERPR